MLNSEALASILTPVIPVVSAVRLAAPRLKFIVEENAAVAANSSRVSPPMMTMMIGLVAGKRGGGEVRPG